MCYMCHIQSSAIIMPCNITWYFIHHCIEWNKISIRFKSQIDRSDDAIAPATHPLMVVIICGKYGNDRCRTEKVTERTRFSKSRSNDLEDIGQGQRSWDATHLLMLVIICTKYGKNPSRTVDATEWKRFSRSRPNDLENIGQGQRSLHATHHLMVMMICAK